MDDLKNKHLIYEQAHDIILLDKKLIFRKTSSEVAFMRIERTKYLQELIDRKHNGLVKESHLSRGKCTCLQILNICRLFIAVFYQNFDYSILQYYRKYDIIQVQYNSRKKTNNNPASNVQS